MRCPGLILFAPMVLGLGLAGCASPGFPRAPSLHLPAPVTDLTATRIADRVELRWTAPVQTTDGLDLTFPTTVEVCRETVSSVTVADGAPPPCTTVLKVAGHPGPSSAVDLLPSSLVDPQAPRRFLFYRVRVLNPSGRAAAPTIVALVPGGPPPAPVDAFHVVQEKEGVLLEWGRPAFGSLPGSLPAGDAASVEVLRTDLKPIPPRASTVLSPAPKPPSNPMPRAQRPGPAAELRLRPDADASAVDGSPLGATPAGMEGMIDRSALPDGLYSYRARRVLTASAGGKSFEMFSESTSPVTMAMRDTFPPASPRGLVSVPGTMGPPSALRPTIDLSWQPNTEADLAGYHVYRTDVTAGGRSEDGNGVRLTASPVAGPAFRDATVRPGHGYAYRITSVDRSGNESPPSAPVQDSPEGR